MRVVGIIPCRWGSTRFPGKPLAEINGMPMMWHVYERALECKSLDTVIIATDDERIEKACRDLGMNVVSTRSDHATGSDRVAEAAMALTGDIFVNIQGDEPMIEAAAIDAVVAEMTQADEAVQAVNAYALFAEMSDVVDPNNVKVVFGDDRRALYFSRQPVPHPKGGKVTYFRQLGLYAFRSSGLAVFFNNGPGPLEQAEGVEMLRLLERGHAVRMVAVVDRSIPVDTPADLERVRTMMKPKAVAA